jgi:hypothetical protein
MLRVQLVGHKTVVRLMLAAMVIGFSVSAHDKVYAQDEAPDTVLELFTSQGCSSCPPADALLGELAKNRKVLALTMPVTYWDYLGWKDTLATEGFGKRQRSYAEARGDHEIYTPQVVINGLAQVVGSREEAITAAIERTGPATSIDRVPLKLDCSRGDIHVKAGVTADKGEHRAGTVWVALYARAVNVSIGRGENNGRKITYTNVVRHLMPAGRWDGRAANYSLKRPAADDSDGCAAFVQADKSSAIIGAAVMVPKIN